MTVEAIAGQGGALAASLAWGALASSGGRGVTSAEVGLVDASTVVVVFSEAITGGDYLTGVTITVDGSPATVSGATLQGDSRTVRYALSAAVEAGQAVTWAYTPGSIAWASGGSVAAIAARGVTNNVASALTGQPIGLLLGLTYA